MFDINVTELTDRELRSLQEEVDGEVRRRHENGPGRVTLASLIRNHNQRLGRADGEPWAPVEGTEAYMTDEEVEHDGELWASVHDFNVAEPGRSGWRPVPKVGEGGEIIPPPYIQPAGAHDAYKHGEQITWTDGKVYAAVRSGVAHSPGDHAASWSLVTSEVPVVGPKPDPGSPEEPSPGEPVEEPLDPWVQPQGAHDAYPMGYEVSHNGQAWKSTVSNNVWAPGVHGWTVM